MKKLLPIILLSACAAMTPAERRLQEDCERACARELPYDMFLSLSDGETCRCLPMDRRPKWR